MLPDLRKPRDRPRVANLAGFGSKEVKVTLDPQFLAFFREQASSLPQWVWLAPIGAPWRSDVWLVSAHSYTPATSSSRY